MWGVKKCRGESKKMFRVLKVLTNKWVPRTDAINDENGVTLTEDEDIKRRWKEYSTRLYETKDYQQTYNRGREKDEPHHSGQNCSRLCSRFEVGTHLEQMIFQLNSERHQGKKVPSYFGNYAQRSDGKGSGQRTGAELYLSRFLKKRNLKEYSNYHTISLISHVSKIMLSIIINRMKVKLEEKISIAQTGFKEGKGTRDQIVNTRNIIEKWKEHRMPLYLCFIDCSKAFDCVSHNEIWMIMTKNGFFQTSNRFGQHH